MFNDYLSEIVKFFKTRMPNVATIETHGGRFDLAEIKRLSRKLPAVFISILQVNDMTEVETGEFDVELTIGVFIITSDQPKLPRQIAAISLIEELVLIIADNQWGMDRVGVHPANLPNAKNLFSKEVDKTGIAIWAISFKQKLRIGENEYAGEKGKLPKSVFVGFTPKIGTAHIDDYDIIGGNNE